MARQQIDIQVRTFEDVRRALAALIRELYKNPEALDHRYMRVTDGSTIAYADGADVLKFRSSGPALTVAVGSDDVTHGDNVLFTLVAAEVANLVKELLALTDLSDVSAKTGTGSTVVMQFAPTITTPNIAIVNAPGSVLGLTFQYNSIRNLLYLEDQGSSAADFLTIRNGNGTVTLTLVNASSTNVHMDLVTKGTGVVKANGVELVTLTGTQTLTNKSISAGQITYTPAVLTDWDGNADPGDLDDALDQLAERVDDVESAVGGMPGGSSGQLQYNNGGVFGGTAIEYVLESGTVPTLFTDGAPFALDATDDSIQVRSHDAPNTNYSYLFLDQGEAAIVSSDGQLKLTNDDPQSVILDFSAIASSDKTVTFPNASGAIVLDTATQTLTNKTLTQPAIADFTLATHDHSDADDGGTIDAAVITYTPAVATDWDGDADPGDVNDALDQLAERVDDLEGSAVTGPAGADTEVQFNDGGAFGADSDFTFDKSVNRLRSTFFRGSTFEYTNAVNSNVITSRAGFIPSGNLIVQFPTFTDTPSTYVLATATQTLTNKTLTAPTIADFTNAQHDHLDADDGGTLTAAAISDFASAVGAIAQPLDATLTSLAAVSGVQGDLLYASGADAWTRLAKDANATRYLSNTGASNNPAWAQVNLANGVTGDLPFANLTQGSALSVLGVTGNATADVASIAAGTDHQVLRRSGTAVAFGAVNLASSDAVTGALAIANGGTGQTSQTAAFDALAPTTTKGDIIVSNGSDNIRLAVGSDGHVLTADSGEASGVKWSAVAGTGDVVGPASVTDNRIVRFDGTTGKLIQSAGLSIADISGDTFEIHRGSGGNTALELTVPATASNFVALTSAASGSPAIIASKSTAAPAEDVDLVLTGFNAGLVKADQDGTPREVATISGTQTLTNKTLTTPTIADFTNATHDHSDADDGGLIDASVITYTPTTATDWDGDADPGDVNDALDQLAERVDDLEGLGGGSGDVVGPASAGDSNVALFDGTTGKLLKNSDLDYTSGVLDRPGAELGLGHAGNVAVDDGVHFELGTSTGTKFGLSTSQKLAFFNATPVDQPGNAEDFKDAIVSLGLLASGGATPLDLDTGDLLAGTLEAENGGTSRAALRLLAQTAPTSPTAGDHWLDSTKKMHQHYAGGMIQSLGGTVFAAITSATVANTTTETTLIGSGIGTLTLPANFWTPGKTVRITAWGTIGTHSSPGTLTIRTKFGALTASTVGTNTPDPSLSTKGWKIETLLTCRTTGGAGTGFKQGAFRISTANDDGDLWEMKDTAEVSLDTTASMVLNITAQWGTANASNSMVCTNVIVEVI